MFCSVRWTGRCLGSSGSRRYYNAFNWGGDIFRVGDFVSVAMPEEEEAQNRANNKPFYWVAQIDALYEEKGEKCYVAKWYYFPEETRYGRVTHKHEIDELFETAHTDENSIDTIKNRVTMLSFEQWKKKKEQELIEKEQQQQQQGQGQAGENETLSTFDRSEFFVRLRYDDDRGEFRPIIIDKLAIANKKENTNTSHPQSTLESDAALARRLQREEGLEWGTAVDFRSPTKRKSSRQDGENVMMTDISDNEDDDDFYQPQSNQKLPRSNSNKKSSTPNSSRRRNSSTFLDDDDVHRPSNIEERLEQLANMRSANNPSSSSSTSSSSSSSRYTSTTTTQVSSIYSRACAQLQLSCVPEKLPCREREKQEIFSFLERGVKNGGLQGGLCK